MGMVRGRAVACGLVPWLLAACVGVGKPEVEVSASPIVGTPPGAIDEVRSADEQPYAMTISGGVSLGAYEAGLNWAVIELMRNHTARQAPRLLGVTGASAGSINALLTAIRWCETRPTSTAEENLFARTWLPIGLDKLLPGRDDDVVRRRPVPVHPARPALARPLRGKPARRSRGVPRGASWAGEPDHPDVVGR